MEPVSAAGRGQKKSEGERERGMSDCSPVGILAFTPDNYQQDLN